MSIHHFIHEIDNSPEAEQYRRHPADQDGPSDWEFILGIFQTGQKLLARSARSAVGTAIADRPPPKSVQGVESTKESNTVTAH
jgi:hypothetical protein